MKTLLLRAPLLALLLAAAPAAFAQTPGVGIGTTAPDASAALDIVSSSKGALLPRMTAAQLAAIASPAPGLLVFQTDNTAGFYYNAGTAAVPAWEQVATASGAAVTATNGLARTGNSVGLGGTLTGNTALALGGFTLGLTGGSVGIGTASPATTLDVRTADASAAITVGKTDATAGALYFGNSSHGVMRNYNGSSNNVGLYTTGGDLYLSASGISTNRFLLTSAGRVGIGNNSPTATLDVNGSTRLRGLATAGVVTTDASGNLGSVASSTLGDHLGNHTATQNLNLAGQALTGSGSSISGVGVGIRADGGLNLGQHGTGNNVLLGYQAGQSLTPDAGTGAGSRNQLSGYQSGAGTTTGQENQFSGYQSGYHTTTGSNNHFSGYRSGHNNTTGIGNVFGGFQSGLHNTTGSDNTALGVNSGPASGSGSLTNATALGANVSLTQSNTLILGNGANVGIGTSAPASTLDVRTADGTARLTVGTTGGTGGGIAFGNPAHGIQRGYPTLNADNNVGFFTTAGNLYLSANGAATGQFALTNGGNVGIGTSSPGQKLEVVGPDAATTATTAGLLRLSRPTISGVKWPNTFDLALGSYDTGGDSHSRLDFNLGDGATGNADQTVLTLQGNGNVGIGTTAPRQALEVAGQVFSSTGGFKFPNNSVQTTAGLTSAGNGLTTAGSNVTLGGALFKATTISQGGFGFSLIGGNVGIGTTSPNERLQVVGNTDVTGNSYVSGAVGIGTDTPGQKLDVRGSTFVSANSYVNGRVGIGTTAPAYPLDVQSFVNTNLSDYGYLNELGTAGFAPGTYSGLVSIRALGRVLASEFNAMSDASLKSICGLSDNAADLGLLNRLRITDYTMRDRVQFGDRAFKKVIAQEVEQVLPQAVTKQTGFLPDVYAPATAVRALAGDSLLVLTLPAGLPTDAPAGQRLKLLGANSQVLAVVARPAAAGSRTLTVRGAQALAGGAVFVYGLEHADVRAVDYEALSMLNVSATQELARQVELLKARAATAEAQLETVQAQATATTEAFEARLRALEASGGQARR